MLTAALGASQITVAVSHHFLSPTGLYNTLRLLRSAPHQVSGIDRGLKRDTQASALRTAAERAEAADEDHARRCVAGRAMHI